MSDALACKRLPSVSVQDGKPVSSSAFAESNRQQCGVVARRSESSGSARQVPGYDVAASPCGAVSDCAMSARLQKQA
jgi:hypothetical protein